MMTTTMTRKMRFICTLAAAAILTGCQSTYTENQVFTTTLLEFDPTEEIVLSEWWTNDTQLLWLQASGAYRLFDEQNPYTTPIERGRWGQKSYRVLWFTDYTQHTGGLKQVRLDKTEGGLLTVLVDDLKPLVAISTRPIVTEDRVLGAWIGDTGSLRLGGDLRYRFDPTPGTPGTSVAPAIIAGHDGAWRVRDGTIVLLPDSPSVDAVRLTIERDEGEIGHLQSPRGPLRRPARAAAESG